jgi:protoheme IX farnesyltransferase
MNIVTAYCLLCRMLISCFAACSALTGYLLTPDRSLSTTLLLTVGVFLLASGASALNQYQERDIDGLMQRTRHRPLPDGIIDPRNALTMAIVLIVCGVIPLSMIDPVVAAIGAIAVLWYNVLYTPLKRTTAFAAVPGALVGALPPVMGWLAGGGNISDPRIFALAILFFLWQIPHFWLLLLRNAAQYEQAGLPTLTSIIPQERLSRITLLWIAAAAVASLAMPLFGIVRSPYAYVPLVILAVWVSGSGLGIIIGNTATAALLPAFRSVNIFILLFMLLAVFDSFLLRG